MRFVMRLAIVALLGLAALGLAACETPNTRETASRAPPLWRVHTEHLVADRALARACLNDHRANCEDVIQAPCRGGFSEEAQSPALDRQCDWRAIAAWEDEMDATLSALRSELSGRDLANLETSQRAWETSMLADVGLGMDRYQGGSLAGPVGAHIRARATAERAEYLEEQRRMTE